MTDPDALTAQVRDVFQKTLKIDPGSLQDDADLRDALNLDSLDMIEVVYALEEKFDVQIPEEKISTIKTFGEVVEGLRRAIEARG